MDPGRLQEIERLFQAASELDPGRRKIFLQESCGGDDALRREVESLLGYHETAGDFLESPAIQDHAAALAGDSSADAAPSMTGRTLGRYQILERVGLGGMGAVYRALDTNLNRTLALKVLRQETTVDHERKTRFVREARAASALNHPNIVTIYDIGQAEGVDFIAMEYIHGQTLQERIASRDLPAHEALEYAVQIAGALAAAHSAGIIHRDIKPANIMITGASSGPRVVKVLDFGIAKLSELTGPSSDSLTNLTGQGIIVGTAAYMSPEQADGKPVDARSDIFSFGAVLYEMFSGRRAFEKSSSFSTLAAVLHEDPKPLTGVSSELEKVVLRCLRKDPNLRYQRTVELKQALDACLHMIQGSALALKSIAVLPFVNLSADKDTDFFSEGLAEEIINVLTKLPGLQVTARTSAFTAWARELDIREIGSKLNVENILEGSVRRAGTRIRITAQLIDIASGYHLWSERYEREMTDVFAIQDDIAHAIVDTLRVRLTKDRPLIKRHTANPEAYTQYFRGRHYQEKRTPEGYARAKECFERALAEDPRFAPAYLGLAEFYWLNALYGFQYPKTALAKAKEATIRALEIDDGLAEGHAILGTLLGIAEFDWKGADRAFCRALELDPNSPFVFYRQGSFYLWPLERPDEAIAALERTLSFDPLSFGTHWVLGYFIYCLRQYERAIKHLRAVIEIEPAFYFAYGIMGMVHLQCGRPEEALAVVEKTSAVGAENPLTIGIRAYIFGRAGKQDEAWKVVRLLEQRAELGYVPAKSFMFAMAGLDEWDQALEWARRAVEDERDPMTIMNLVMEPLFDPVRTDPRYLALLRSANLRS